LKILILLFFTISCSTRTKTIIYSSMSGAVAGGAIGRGFSPNRESDAFNITLGAISGAAFSALLGNYFYSEAHPELELQQLPLDRDTPPPITPPLLSMPIFKNEKKSAL